ncbi:hypothetical protein GUITHDRAFT_135852 [Guillardia theta CCMP2712]|uniref:Uncharacterized protein n=1 Tax=Guillardia theta (strain CCMP2712) TaxID=905079 RepID=L1JNB3_GUITC|nr:hypothetical protein GUITHDRAFT_135852 [Guillardia theta CCMP2712]EKX49680.1 hypothetical protein GUITHDRAFT_135852 [Guillardia theta CCMP2712]|eukprot:XP_005836660.1 hypothetical protein GUITHDRAFT_135852 [Guillardia theta CCMP2712]
MNSDPVVNQLFSDLEKALIKPIFVDIQQGSDTEGTGEAISPYKSFRYALRRWLKPGRCAPYCGDSSLKTSAVIFVRAGQYSGGMNENIELFLPRDVSLVIIKDPRFPCAEQPPDWACNFPVSVNLAPWSYWIKVEGGGFFSVSNVALRNSSSDAIVVQGKVSQVYNIYMYHGIFGSVEQVDTNGTISFVPNWDVEEDLRMQGRAVNCSAQGCYPGSILPAWHENPPELLPLSDASYQTWTLPASNIFPGEFYGLSVYVVSTGSGCINGGELVAKHEVAGGQGSGFSARFAIVNGSLSGLELVDTGSGYTSVSNLSIVIARGGEGCVNVSFQPFLVPDAYPYW